MTESLTLAEITRKHGELEALIQESGGELTEELETAFDEILEQSLKKIDGYSYLIEKSENSEAFWRDKSKQAQRVAQSCKKLHEKLKAHLLYNLQNTKTHEIRGESVGYKIAKNPEKLEFDEDLLPKEYFIQVVNWAVDKERLKADLKEGKEIKGAKLTRGERITPFHIRGE